MINNSYELKINIPWIIFPESVAKPFNCVAICDVKHVILHLEIYTDFVSLFWTTGAFKAQLIL